MRFPIVIHEVDGGGYRVTVPDLPGCRSAGETVDEAMESAREAIAGHVERLLMEGEPIPAPASLQAHHANEDHRGGVWAIVSTDVSKLSGRARRINISLPARVLAIVDQAAAREGRSRSGLLAHAALSYVQRQAEGRLGALLTDRPAEGRSYRADRGPRGRPTDDG